MENETNTIDKNVTSKIESLPANTSWFNFFKSAYFGKNFFQLKGRASRREYWAVAILATLYQILLASILFFIAMIDTLTGTETTTISIGILSIILSWYIVIPIITMSVRRFHDINISGWYTLLLIPNLPYIQPFLLKKHMIFICLLSLIPHLLLCFMKGDRKDNRFGANIYPEPKQQDK